MAGVPSGVFSSDAFLAALDHTWFGGECTVADVGVGDHVIRTLVHRDEPVVDVTFLDYFAAIPGASPELTARYAPRVASTVRPVAARDAIDPLVCEPAPFVDWSRFESWDGVLAHWKANEKGIVRESRRRANRLAEQMGPLRFTFDDRRAAAFEACLVWKGAQFRDSGHPDPFDDPREQRLLRALWDDGIAVLSTLEAGDRLVAAHLGLVSGGATHWWLPTYDRETAWASPGRLLLEWVMQQSYERSDERFDFLRGGSSYKWNYATGWCEVREAGRLPLRRLATLARHRAVRRYPRLAGATRAARDVVRPYLPGASSTRERVA